MPTKIYTNKEERYVNVFWCSGFDSTYLVCDLVQRGYNVRPFYIKNCITKDGQNHDRQNQQREIDLFPILTDEIHKIGRGRISEPTFIEAKEYASKRCGDILSSYDPVFSREHQYSYLANYCFQTKQNICIGLENVPRPKGSVGPWLKEFVGIHGEYLNCRPNETILEKHDELEIIMNWRFPIVYKKKIELAIESIKRGFHHILKQTTSCRRNDPPCGICGICVTRKKCVDVVYNIYEMSGVLAKDTGETF